MCLLFFFYLFMASFPLLLFVLTMTSSEKTWSFHELTVFSPPNLILMILSYGAFLTKLPVFFLHLWLPKAHVEAPIYGSMILAGVMLKLGSYGLLKFLKMTIFFLMTPNFTGIFVFCSLTASLMCLFSLDLKVLVAYSSVSHMTFLTPAVLSSSIEAWSATVVNMISHGLISSNLFYMLNVTYERVKSRSVFLVNSQVLGPMYNFLIMLVVMSNFSAPPFISFFSELFLMTTYMFVSSGLIISMGLYFVFSTAYSLNLMYPNKTNWTNTHESNSSLLSEYTSLVWLSLLTGYNSFMTYFMIF